MTLTVNNPYLIGSPCGHHGQYTFYKAFKYQLRNNSKFKILMLGEFFFLRISPHDDPCIGELQLLWEDRNSDQLLSSTRLYFLPEQTPDGRQSHHGEHEVLAASDKVILRLSDLVSWITDQVDWMTGLKTQTIITPTINNNNNSNSDNNSKYQWQSLHNSLHQSLHQSLHPIAINSGLDFNDVIHEKQVNGDVGSSSSVVVLSYPRYCRYRALLRRIEGRESEWMNKESVQLAINSLGIPTTTNKLNILFCRDTFEHEALLQNDLNCDHLAPKLKGRPRKKQPVSKSGCQRSSSPESNTSDESKTSQIRTTRRSALNRSNSIEKSVRGNSVKNSNKVNNAKLKDICIKNEQTFLKQLNKFMRERKTPIQRVPHLGFKQIDLYFFYTHAQKLGGYDKITSNKLWKKLYDEMGGDPGSTSAATCTRRHYERLLLPFERHLNGDQDKRKGRKATSSGAKRGKKQTQRTTDSSNTNAIKYKRKVGKQVVNGVKGKSKCDHQNYSDSTPQKKQQLDDEPKQPKLIVKLNLLKVKSQQKSQIATTDNQVTDDCVKDEQSKVKPEANHSGSDTEDTDNDKKELKREDLTEEEDEIVDEVENGEQEVETELKNSVDNQTVMHLSPVSDISNDEVPVCDNKIESSTASSMIATQTQTLTLAQSQTQNLTQPLLSDTKNSISSVSSLQHPIACTTSSAPLPFPVAASPLFSISTLVNSVKVETITPSPPPMSATTLAPPPPPQISPVPTKSIASKPIPMSSSSLQIKRTSYDIYQRRPSVIHKTSNPMLTVAEHQSKQQNISNNKNIPSVPLPAHCSFKSECEPKRMASDFACNDVLDLSVKKRYLEADSRTSPSQVSIDDSFGLDLSLKKKKIESPKLQVPKPKLETVSPTLLPTSMLTPLPQAPQKSCPPQPAVNIVPQSVHKSVHYHQALPHIESHAKHQSKQHHQREQQIEKHHSSQQQIVKPQVRHPPQVSMVSQSTHQMHHNSNHNNHRQHSQQQQQQQPHHNSVQHALQRQRQQQQQHQHQHQHQQRQQQQQQQRQRQQSPKIESELLSSKMLHQSLMSMPTHPSSVRPAISEYNPSLPTFYTSSFWWQNAPSLHPNSVSTTTPFMSPSIASVSPHLIGGHPLIPSASYPTDHLLSQFDSNMKAANLAAFKQLTGQQQYPYNFFQHSFYATK